MEKVLDSYSVIELVTDSIRDGADDCAAVFAGVDVGTERALARWQFDDADDLVGDGLDFATGRNEGGEALVDEALTASYA